MNHRHLRPFALMFALPGVLVPLLLLGGCGAADSPEQQVKRVIGQMELAAEERDIGELMEHVSEDFRDPYGQGPQEVSRYAHGYFIANQSIHLLTRIDELTFPTDGEARVKVLVGMVGRDADASSKWDLAADLHEFKVSLRREDGEWKVSFAEWQRK